MKPTMEDRIAQVRAEIDAFIDVKVEAEAKECPGVPRTVIRGMMTAKAAGCQCAQYLLLTTKAA